MLNEALTCKQFEIELNLQLNNSASSNTYLYIHTAIRKTHYEPILMALIKINVKEYATKRRSEVKCV